MKKLIQTQLLYPLLSFLDENSLNFPESWLTIFFTLTTASAVPSRSLQKLMDNFLAEGEKLIQINFFTPSLVFLDENSDKYHFSPPSSTFLRIWIFVNFFFFSLNFPGKLISHLFTASLQPVQNYQAFASKLMDNFSSRGWKGWFKSTASFWQNSLLLESSFWTLL